MMLKRLYSYSRTEEIIEDFKMEEALLAVRSNFLDVQLNG